MPFVCPLLSRVTVDEFTEPQANCESDCHACLRCSELSGDWIHCRSDVQHHQPCFWGGLFVCMPEISHHLWVGSRRHKGCTVERIQAW